LAVFPQETIAVTSRSAASVAASAMERIFFMMVFPLFEMFRRFTDGGKRDMRHIIAQGFPFVNPKL
jgi:hypothetical protein